MRVLIAGHIGQPIGGLATYCEDLLDSKLKEYVSLYFVETSGGEFRYNQRGRWGFANILNSIWNIKGFLDKVINLRPDIIHITTAYNPSFLKHAVMLLFAKTLRIKVILQPHCGFEKIFTPDSLIQRKFAEFIFRSCNGVLIISPEWFALKSKIDVLIRYVPNGICLEKYLSINRNKPIDEDKFNILYLGHIGYDKGTFDLLKSVKSLEDLNYHFVVTCVGESISSGDFEEMEVRVRELHLDDYVQIRPSVYGDEKLGYFANADLFVLPSYHEGMPISILEAMACGLPVIASNVGGISELVGDKKTGLLISAGDIDALSRAIEYLMKDPLLARRMGQLGRKKALESFDINDRANEIYDFYKSVL
jgi:glycosyltransferase involved in cell wall biosynthesis